jgi:hypothetical protein
LALASPEICSYIGRVIVQFSMRLRPSSLTTPGDFLPHHA